MSNEYVKRIKKYWVMIGGLRRLGLEATGVSIHAGADESGAACAACAAPGATRA